MIATNLAATMHFTSAHNQNQQDMARPPIHMHLQRRDYDTTPKSHQTKERAESNGKEHLSPPP
jgi:hypothetical protein